MAGKLLADHRSNFQSRLAWNAHAILKSLFLLKFLLGLLEVRTLTFKSLFESLRV